MDKKVGVVLLVAGVLLVLSALGQDGYETHAFVHGKVVETVSFKTQVLAVLAGITSITIGWSLVKEVKDERG